MICDMHPEINAMRKHNLMLLVYRRHAPIVSVNVCLVQRRSETMLEMFLHGFSQWLDLVVLTLFRILLQNQCLFSELYCMLLSVD